MLIFFSRNNYDGSPLSPIFTVQSVKSPVVVKHVQILIFLLSTVPPQDDSSVSSEDMNAAEPTWVAAEQPPVPEPSPPNGDTVSNPAAAVKEEDGEAPRSESCPDSLSGRFIYI